MTEEFALGRFLARWSGQLRHDLSASESATLSLPSLLALAEAEDRARWEALAFGYADPHGASWLRTSIAARYRGLAPDHISCSAGAQEGLACVARALLAPGDHAIVVLPIYQPSERAVTALCAASGVVLEEHRGHWRLDPDRIAAAISTRDQANPHECAEQPDGCWT